MNDNHVCVVEFEFTNGDLSKEYLCGMSEERIDAEIQALKDNGFKVVARYYQNNI